MQNPLPNRLIFKYAALTEENRANSQQAPHHMSSGLVHPEAPDDFHLSVNYRPDIFENTFSNPAQEFGQCSQTIHAEIANISAFPGRTSGSHMFHDPHCCPNCAKDEIVAGVGTVYINRRARNGHYALVQAKLSAGGINPFETLTLPLFKAWGVNVLEVDAVREIITPLNLHPHFAPVRWPRTKLFDSTKNIDDLIYDIAREHHPVTDWSIARVNTGGHIRVLFALSAGPPNVPPDTPLVPIGKFSPIIDSLSVLLMTAKRRRMTILDNTIGSNHVPYPRSLFNAAAFGINRIAVMQLTPPDRAHDRLEAFTALTATGIITSNLSLA